MANAESVATSTAAQAQRQRPHSRRHSLRYGLQEPLDVTVLRSGVPDSVPGRSLNVGSGWTCCSSGGRVTAG